MRRIVAIITVNELCKQQHEYPPWEIPILELVHGDQIELVGETRCNLRVPEPEDEYLRLERRFGFNKETRVARVAEVYGHGSIGVENLRTAMAADLAEQAELDRQAADAEQPREAANGDVVAAGDSDPAQANGGKKGRKPRRGK